MDISTGQRRSTYLVSSRTCGGKENQAVRIRVGWCSGSVIRSSVLRWLSTGRGQDTEGGARNPAPPSFRSPTHQWPVRSAQRLAIPEPPSSPTAIVLHRLVRTATHRTSTP